MFAREFDLKTYRPGDKTYIDLLRIFIKLLIIISRSLMT